MTRQQISIYMIVMLSVMFLLGVAGCGSEDTPVAKRLMRAEIDIDDDGVTDDVITYEYGTSLDLRKRSVDFFNDGNVDGVNTFNADSSYEKEGELCQEEEGYYQERPRKNEVLFTITLNDDSLTPEEYYGCLPYRYICYRSGIAYIEENNDSDYEVYGDLRQLKSGVYLRNTEMIDVVYDHIYDDAGYVRKLIREEYSGNEKRHTTVITFEWQEL